MTDKSALAEVTTGNTAVIVVGLFADNYNNWLIIVLIYY